MIDAATQLLQENSNPPFLFQTIVSNSNTQQIAAGDVATWNVLIAPQNGITAAAIFIVSEL